MDFAWYEDGASHRQYEIAGARSVAYFKVKAHRERAEHTRDLKSMVDFTQIFAVKPFVIRNFVFAEIEYDE